MSIPPLQCSTTGKLRPRENVSSPRDAEWMHMQNDAKWCNMMHNRNERIQKSNMTNIHYISIHNTKIVWKNVSSGFRTPSLHFLIQPIACILGGIRQCCRVCLLLEGNRVNCQPGIFQIKFMKCNQSGGSSHKLFMRLYTTRQKPRLLAPRGRPCAIGFFSPATSHPSFLQTILNS